MSIADRTDKGDLRIALKNAADLLAHDPQLAEEQAHEILKVYADSVDAKRVLASAFRLPCVFTRKKLSLVKQDTI